MRDLKAELEQLRRKLERLEKRTTPDLAPVSSAPPSSEALPPWEYAETEGAFERSLTVPGTLPPAQAPAASTRTIEDHVGGRTFSTPTGTHIEVETLYPQHADHGHFAVSQLATLAPDLLTSLCGDHTPCPPTRWAFLDTETTGLAGGAGTFAFLIGIGFATEAGFTVRQYFLREPAEEPSVLHRIAEDLAGFQTLITYNGRSFDLPLLETRYRLARSRVPFAGMPHLDLLYSCRRLWKLRFDDCRLTSLEAQVLGHQRQGDVPGFLIPSLYTDYLRSGDARPLLPVFTHNALDILSLACLTGVVASVYRNPEGYSFRHPGECVGLGRWMRQMGDHDAALRLLQRAANAAIPEDLLARTLWEISQILRQANRFAEAVRPLVQLLDFPNTYRTRALEALAILYEHRLRDYPMAMRYARDLESERPDEDSARRLERLSRRLRGLRQRRLDAAG